MSEVVSSVIVLKNKKPREELYPVQLRGTFVLFISQQPTHTAGLNKSTLGGLAKLGLESRAGGEGPFLIMWHAARTGWIPSFEIFFRM